MIKEKDINSVGGFRSDETASLKMRYISPCIKIVGEYAEEGFLVNSISGEASNTGSGSESGGGDQDDFTTKQFMFDSDDFWEYDGFKIEEY